MKGKLYGVGIGPGDPELLTLKAVKIIEQSDIIAVPGGSDSKLAYNTVQNFIKDKEIIICEFSMNPDIALRTKYRKEIFKQICEILSTGKNIAFLTIGDPTIYSTYMYIHNMIKDTGYRTEIISGIPSFIATAGRLNSSLCQGEELLHIIPSSKIDKEQIKEYLNFQGNKVFMKSGRNLKVLLDTLNDEGVKDVKIIEKCCLEGEQIFNNIDQVKNISEIGYFTIVIVKE